MGNSAIEVAGLRVVRGGTRVIESLDLTVPAGQVVGLLGPSGSGKTTLMRAIVGAQIVDGGDVTVLGLPAGRPRCGAAIGYVTQSPERVRRPHGHGEPAVRGARSSASTPTGCRGR